MNAQRAVEKASSSAGFVRSSPRQSRKAGGESERAETSNADVEPLCEESA